MSEVTVFGIRCPWSGDERDARDWRYRLWFAAYWRIRVGRHWVGIHDKPRGYSIAPRCDWCGHRSRRQRATATATLAYFDATSPDLPDLPAAQTSGEGMGADGGAGL